MMRKTSGNDAQVQIFEKAGHEHVHELQHEAEQNAHRRAAGRKKDHLQAGEQGKLDGIWRTEYVRLYAQKQGGLSGDQGRADAGDQGGVVHDAHAGNLHGEKGGGHGRAEQGGEGRRHAAHQDDLLVLFIQTEQVPHRGAKGRAHLQGGAFPAHGAAEQDGDDGGNKDQARHSQRDGHLRMDAFDDGIRPVIVFIMKSPV